MMNGMDGMMGGGLGMIFGLILWVALTALIVWLLMRLFSNRRGAEHPVARGDSAEEIVRERFARGEIGAEEYQRSLEVLRGKTGVDGPRTGAR